MITAMLAAAAIAAILIVSEFIWKKVNIHEEIARKLVHILAGSFIAFLPFWVDYNWIKVLAVGFILVNGINHFTKTISAIQAVRRKSYGDILFGVGVLIVALFEPATWLFTTSILQVALADGLAAISGVTLGQKYTKYYLFGQQKTLLGSSVFLLSSMAILLITFLTASYFADPMSLWPVLVMLPLLLVCAENVAVYGTDNIVLPVLTLIALSLL